jgi:hypothetical protein
MGAHSRVSSLPSIDVTARSVRGEELLAAVVAVMSGLPR